MNLKLKFLLFLSFMKMHLCQELLLGCDQLKLSVKDSKTIQVHKNGKLAIKCSSTPARSGDHNTNIKWMRKSLDGKNKNFTTANTKTLKDLHKGDTIWDEEELSFSKFSPEDSGIYVCNSDTCNKTVSVLIKMIKPSKPEIEITGENIMLEEEPHNLTCYAMASPPAQVSWHFKGKLIKTCNAQPCTLFVDEVKNTHPYQFNYTCNATNEIGTKLQSAVVHVWFAPEVIRSHSGVYNTRTLSCSINRAYPSAKFVWQTQTVKCFHNKSCIPYREWQNVSKDFYKVSESQENGLNTSSLLILKQNVYAYFRCLAYNKAGSDSDVIQVHIKDSEDVFTSRLKKEVIAAIVVACLLFVILALFICYYQIRRYLDKRYAKFLSPFSDYQIKPDVNITDQGIYLPYNPAYEYPRSKLEFIKVLGSGAFGQVWLARGVDIYNWSQNITSHKRQRKTSLQEYIRKTSRSNNNKTNCTTFVAVKTLKDDATESEYKDLASEIKILIHLGKHPNIVNLLGACTKGGSLFAILEYCSHGDLKTYLKNGREHFSMDWRLTVGRIPNSLTIGDVMYFALQIAKGMTFLHNKKLIHRDLACRNILLGDSFHVKISDFGLARDIQENDCYMKTTTGMLPVKWMSPEALFDRLYNTKSDVWSFGVVLWEISTLGGTPYPGIPIEDLFTYISRGYRMPKPEVCLDELYGIMEKCWKADMNDRPEFEELYDIIEDVLKMKLQDSQIAVINNERNSMDANERVNGACSSHHGNSGKPRYILDSMIRFLSPKRRPESTTEHHLLGRLSSGNYSDVIEQDICA